MRFNRSLYRLAASVLPTGGTGYGLLPTAQTQGLKRCEKGKTAFMPLGLLPTPHASDADRGGQQVTGLYKTRKSGQTYMSLLNDLAASGLLPTPKASDCQSPGEHGEGGAHLSAVVASPTGKTSRLNPLFVAEMMGFPPDWTVLPFLRGAKDRSKPTEAP